MAGQVCLSLSVPRCSLAPPWRLLVFVDVNGLGSLAPLWRLLGASLGLLGAPWGSLGLLEASWGSLGLLGAPWGSLGLLGAPWGSLGAPWGFVMATLCDCTFGLVVSQCRHRDESQNVAIAMWMPRMMHLVSLGIGSSIQLASAV